MAKPAHCRLRIIAGQWRGRKLVFPDRKGLRPTPDRVRETLFNWLQPDLPGSSCLDLFAGSGALGFEAASRGASHVSMIDNDAESVSMLESNAGMLSARQIEVIRSDASGFLQRKSRQYDIVFLDPPYQADLLGVCCGLLESRQWLANHAKIYLESDAHNDLSGIPENWQCLKSKKAGQVGYHLYTRTLLENAV